MDRHSDDLFSRPKTTELCCAEEIDIFELKEGGCAKFEVDGLALPEA
jgi:hypothetical protein